MLFGEAAIVHTDLPFCLVSLLLCMSAVQPRSSQVDKCAVHRQEAWILERLQSSHIIAFHDFNLHTDGRPYLVSELARGTTIGQGREAFTQGRGGPWGGHLPGLAVAHHQGIVHRDLKPSNVMLCRTRNQRWLWPEKGVSAPDDQPELRLSSTPKPIKPLTEISHTEGLAALAKKEVHLAQQQEKDYDFVNASIGLDQRQIRSGSIAGSECGSAHKHSGVPQGIWLVGRL